MGVARNPDIAYGLSNSGPPLSAIVALDHTKGIPRRINNLATACLLAAFAEQKNLIERLPRDDLGG